MLTGILVVLALLAGVAGLVSLSQATLGVGVMGMACLLAIFARIVQASDQHGELKKRLGEIAEESKAQSRHFRIQEEDAR